MGPAPETSLRAILPVWTLVMSGGAVAAYLSPQTASCLIYDRQAVLGAEIWRLVSGHLVHFDLWHLAYNLTAFLVGGWLLENKIGRSFGWLCLGIALTIGLFLVLAKPMVASYGGLSGLATGVWFYLALCTLKEAPASRLWGWLLLGLLVVKLAGEYVSGDSVLFYPSIRSFHPLWESHALGSLAALGLFLCQDWRRREWSGQGQATDDCSSPDFKIT